MEMKAMNSFSSKAKELPAIAIPLESSNHVQQTEPDKVTSSSPTPSTPNPKNCLCSPTTHAGSFRCRLHRSLQKQWSMGNSRLPSPPPEEVQVPSTVTITKTVEENWVA